MSHATALCFARVPSEHHLHPEPFRTLTPSLFSRRVHLRELSFRVRSTYLDRDVDLSVLLPPGYRLHLLTRYPLVLLNDGQDFPALELAGRLERAYSMQTVRRHVVVGIHANRDRMREYGTSRQPDYQQRGDRADDYRQFVVRELLPFLEAKFRLRQNRSFRAIAGFSLGGLSAFDIAWQHETKFSAVGCFSASFWWRSAAFKPAEPDADRIIVDRIERSIRAAQLHYFFMAGTAEEDSDRNGNGIIDAIDDTLAVMKALKARGIAGRDVVYREVQGGRHDQATWGPVLIDWLSTLRPS